MLPLPRRAAMRASILVLAIAACSRKAPPPPPPPVTPGDAAVAVGVVAGDAGVTPVYLDPAKDPVDPQFAGTGKTFMVVSEHPVATAVGKDILAAGGNAVDAAVATAFALAVVHPTAGNLGGGGFAVVRVAPNKAVALDFRETAPGAATATMFLDDKGNPTDASIVGHRASGVPGSVAGLHALHGKLGKLKWARLVAPAIALARDGFEVNAYLADALSRARSAVRLKQFPATAAVWFPGGKSLEAGTKVQLPELATTLERIAKQGPDGFYKGPTAKAIVDEMKRGGGIITAADLAGYQPIWRAPLRAPYRGYTITSMPPPSSGGIVLAMTAGMLGTTKLGELPWHGTEHVHLVVEAWKRGFAARNELLGDPKYVKDMPIDKLLSPAYQAALAKTITEKATPAKAVPALIEGTHTTNLCVVDGNGMAVALTTTLNTSFGSGVTVTGAGFLLNNEMDDFTAKPGSPNLFGLVQSETNKIEPGKRMLSSMAPTIVEDKEGALVMLAGAAGGPHIITAVWQAISNVIDFEQSAATAVASPRFHHQHLPDFVKLDPGAIDRATEEALRAKGHDLRWQKELWLGTLNAIVRGKDGWHGAADPRGAGAAMGD